HREPQDPRHGHAVRTIHQRSADPVSCRGEDRDHERHGAGDQTQRRDPAPADSGRIHRGAQDLSRSRDQARRIYIPCGGWGSIHNTELLEKYLDTTVVSWMNAMIWSSLRRGKVAGAIHGFGKLLASL